MWTRLSREQAKPTEVGVERIPRFEVSLHNRSMADRRTAYHEAGHVAAHAFFRAAQIEEQLVVARSLTHSSTTPLSADGYAALSSWLASRTVLIQPALEYYSISACADCPRESDVDVEQTMQSFRALGQFR